VKSGIFERVAISVRRRAESWVEIHGNHAESAVEITKIVHISAGIGFSTYSHVIDCIRDFDWQLDILNTYIT
jgi:hypothetical protein